MLLGLALLLIAGVVALFLPRGGHRPTAPPTTTAPGTTATTTAPPAPQGLFVAPPTLSPTSPSSVELRFQTTEPARAAVTYGIDGVPPT
ncbi:MAG: hypothetical protein QOH73_1142, partial [Gaiellaceae bacterium]|nr:hypothetical protein [Gaiellaceae bacterium]